MLAALFGQEVMDRIAHGLRRDRPIAAPGTPRKTLDRERQRTRLQEPDRANCSAPAESSLFSAYAAGGLGAGAFGSEVTSWLGAIGASWSAQPFGQEQSDANSSCTSTRRSSSTAAPIPTQRSGSMANPVQLTAGRHLPLPFPLPGRQLRHPDRRGVARWRRAALRLVALRARHRPPGRGRPHRAARAPVRIRWARSRAARQLPIPLFLP